MAKTRVLFVLSEYPTLSQTYKENEIKYVYADCEVAIASFQGHNKTYAQHFPYTQVQKYQDVSAMVKVFRPDVLHGHYLHTVGILHRIAEAHNLPYTIRSHSFDILRVKDDAIQKVAPMVNSDLCRGFLAFPFLRDRLVRCGIDNAKIFDAWPVVDFDRFYDRSPNGNGIMNTGACIPKKNMESFIELSMMMPDRDFTLFPIGYDTEQIVAYNQARGNPVRIVQTLEPFNMPYAYKRQEWLVYSGNPLIPTIGWPMAIAEAQAAGVGVLVHNVRPDIAEYVGEAGYLFGTIEEAKDILSAPFPNDRREAGIEQARKSDIKVNIKQLMDLWDAKR